MFALRDVGLQKGIVDFSAPSRRIPLPLLMVQPWWHEKGDGDLLWGGVWIGESSKSSPLLGSVSSNGALPTELPLLGAESITTLYGMVLTALMKCLEDLLPNETTH